MKKSAKKCGECSTLAEESLFDLGCGHFYCLDCWRTYLTEEFISSKKSILEIACIRCRKLVTDEIYRKALKEEQLHYYEAYLNTIPESANTLADFGYSFNEQGQLVNNLSKGSFHFVSQLHLDTLYSCVADHIQQQLTEQFGLVESWVPWGDEVELAEAAITREEQSNIFMSPTLGAAQTVLILIQGSGGVRPGQWSRSVCVNEGLEFGSIFPFLRAASANGWGVLVANPNHNSPALPGSAKPTREDFLRTTPAKAPAKSEKRKEPLREPIEPNLEFIWRRIVATLQAENLLVVAHSMGGARFLSLFDQHPKDVIRRVKGVAFTDSVHNPKSFAQVNPSAAADEEENDRAEQKRQFLQSRAIHWVASALPLDTPEPFATQQDLCTCVSAGSPRHEMTTGTSASSICNFFSKILARE